MAKKAKREKYYNIRQLKERGWTQSKIDAWLKEPDVLVKNPIYSSAAPSKLFLKTRVHRQERNKRFKEWLDKSKNKRTKLSKSLKKANEDKKNKLMDYINNLEIVIPVMSLEELTLQAIEHYNDLWEIRGNYEKHATIDSDRQFLNRITMNMLRHQQEHYELELERLFGKVGKDEAYIALKTKINKEILKIYPTLGCGL